MTQYVAVLLIVAVAVGYAVWRVRQLWLGKSNPCAGCDGCALKPQKKQDCDKKTNKKFGQSK